MYHPEIKKKLNLFISTGNIPNIIFHGANGSGKRNIVHNFISDIYKNNKELIKTYVMYVNCAQGKGIKFVRDDLKFFAKTHVNVDGTGNFKTIVLANADELTIDAQSALRRCIELFSHTTRFFIIVQDKYKLLKPILSRLCEIFVYEPIINGKKQNLHKYKIQQTFGTVNEKIMFKSFDKMFLPLKIKSLEQNTNTVIDAVIDPPDDDDSENSNLNSIIDINADYDYTQLVDMSVKLYEKGYSGLDLINYIENNKDIDPLKIYQMLLVLNKIKKEFRNEKLFILFILNFMLLRSDYDLENISFM